MHAFSQFYDNTPYLHTYCKFCLDNLHLSESCNHITFIYIFPYCNKIDIYIKKLKEMGSRMYALKVKEKIRRNGFSSGKPFLLLGPRNKANYAVIRLKLQKSNRERRGGSRREGGERKKKKIT